MADDALNGPELPHMSHDTAVVGDAPAGIHGSTGLLLLVPNDGA